MLRALCIVLQLFNSKFYNRIASFPTIIISALFHEYVLWAPFRFIDPILFGATWHIWKYGNCVLCDFVLVCVYVSGCEEGCIYQGFIQLFLCTTPTISLCVYYTIACLHTTMSHPHIFSLLRSCITSCPTHYYMSCYHAPPIFPTHLPKSLFPFPILSPPQPCNGCSPPSSSPAMDALTILFRLRN